MPITYLQLAMVGRSSQDGSTLHLKVSGICRIKVEEFQLYNDLMREMNAYAGIKDKVFKNTLTHTHTHWLTLTL